MLKKEEKEKTENANCKAATEIAALHESDF